MKLLGISERRFVVYCRSGSTKLIDSESTNPRLNLVDVTLEGDDTVQFRDASDRATDVCPTSRARSGSRRRRPRRRGS
jgi:hypothetical protein